MKVCGRCKLEKCISNFGVRGKRGDLKAYCKPCENEYKKHRYRETARLGEIKNIEGEIWLPVVGYENLYEISNKGRIKATAGFQEKILAIRVDKLGYTSVGISGVGKRKTVKPHRLVAIAFLPNPNGHREINHINGIKTDNRVENLEWCTRSHNMLHAHETGLVQPPLGEKSILSRLKEAQVIEIKEKLKNGVSMYKLGKEYAETYFNL